METEIRGPFPLRQGFRTIQSLAVTVVLLMVILSVLGLAIPDQLYPDTKMVDEFMTNDLINLVIGLPLYLVSLYNFRRRNLLGILLLPGALLYTIYNYFAYLLGQPFSWLGVVHLILVLLCVYLFYFLLSRLDHDFIQDVLSGRTSESLTGWILTFMGLAFIVLALSEILPGILEGSIPPLGEKAVSVADILLSSAWIYGGVSMLCRRPLGYSLGLGLLLAASSLFIGLILYFFFAPLLIGRALDWIEVLTVFVMGMICFVPSILFLRGVLQAE